MMKLYGHVNRTAANTLKLRVALAEAGAPYEYVALDLSKGEQRRPEFLAVNPHGKVPVLVDGEFTLPESDAILWYLAEKFPAARLLPEDIRGRARALQWCDFASTAIYPVYSDRYRHTVMLPPEQRLAAVAESARANLDRALGVLEQALAAREHLAGAFSIADLGAAAVLHWLRVRLPFDDAARPATMRWFLRVTGRPSWQDAIQI